MVVDTLYQRSAWKITGLLYFGPRLILYEMLHVRLFSNYEGVRRLYEDQVTQANSYFVFL